MNVNYKVIDGEDIYYEFITDNRKTPRRIIKQSKHKYMHDKQGQPEPHKCT